MTNKKLARTRAFTLPNTDLQFIMRNDGVVQYYNAVDGKLYNAFYKREGKWMQIISLEVYTSETLDALNAAYAALTSGSEE